MEKVNGKHIFLCSIPFRQLWNWSSVYFENFPVGHSKIVGNFFANGKQPVFHRIFKDVEVRKKILLSLQVVFSTLSCVRRKNKDLKKFLSQIMYLFLLFPPSFFAAFDILVEYKDFFKTKNFKVE